MKKNPIGYDCQTFTKTYKMTIDPVKAVTCMMYLLGILMIATIIFSKLEKKETPEWFFAVFFLFCSMSVIHAAFKHMQKRIDALEEQLNEKQKQIQQDK